MENDDGVGGIGDIDDSALLDLLEKADVENTSNDNVNAGGQGTYTIKTNEGVITPSLIKTELEHLEQDLDDLMMDMVAADMVDEEPPKVKQEAYATSGPEAGAGTSVSAGQPKINVKTEMPGYHSCNKCVPITELMSPTGQSMETEASTQQQQQV